ncbi:hypothetical protein GEU84_009830 [Fertoebacter nigrum]|uniref:Peptidase inhibitor I78 family protein n=1 Tax=Fertoeibacter niger TaxID=2656921 RepID=A0A8X8GX11_9RHOB|nr:hypothetical protein [Fertoeibacter niger]
MRLLPIVPCLVLVACAPPAPVRSPGSTIDPVPCGAAAMQDLIGQPASVLPASGPPGSLRLIRPGDAVTEDFSATRLNVMLDARDRITALTCG